MVKLEGKYYTVFSEFEVSMKVVRLIKICLKMYTVVHTGKHFSERFPIQNDLKQWDILSPPFFIFVLECAIRKVQENQVGQKLNGTLQLLARAYNVKLLGDNMDTIKNS
jgi:hypothetical protein